jgi:subtilisin family serine protease
MRTEKSGTSMAAPHVAGIVALLFEEFGDLSPGQVASLLTASADIPAGGDAFDTAWGYGRVNAPRALALLRDPNQPGRGTGIV